MAVQAAGAEELATVANSVGPDRPRREVELVMAGATEVTVVPVEEDKQKTAAGVSVFLG